MAKTRRVDPALLRPEDPNTLRGDIAKARRELGWEPTVRFRICCARWSMPTSSESSANRNEKRTYDLKANRQPLNPKSSILNPRQMRIAVIGTGYVGLVTGTCFAESGNDVTCIDIDAAKIDALHRGEIPIYEPGLTELVQRNAAAGRLHFTTDLARAVASRPARVSRRRHAAAADGAADLTDLLAAVDSIAPHLAAGRDRRHQEHRPGRHLAKIAAPAAELTGRECDVASNPEFLKEGAAIDDFMKPDRVVVGVRRPEVADVLRELYAPFLRTEHPFLVMSPESAEMTKYVANAMLATKISFINEIANLCERLDADINDVRRGIGHDSRIGFAFLFPGAGYGGSCFPKDVRALAAPRPAARRRAANSGRGRSRQHPAERRAAGKIDAALRRRTRRQDDRRRGAWRSSRAPTTSARRRRSS